MSLTKKDAEAYLSAKADRLCCAACGGHVVFFDMGFVEESLPKIVEPANPTEKTRDSGCNATDGHPKQGLWHKFLGLTRKSEFGIGVIKKEITREEKT